MTSFSGLGIGLSLVFGCLLLALVAELYYLLWWRKRRISSPEIEDHYTKYAREFLQFICWKRPSSFQPNNSQESVRGVDANGQEPDPELGSGKDFLLKAYGDEGVESELMRLHNLAGPPRFLFTIKEETGEDLESEDGKSRGDRSRRSSRTKSLGDFVPVLDSPFLTPLASPPVKSSPMKALSSYSHHGFNPLFESSADAELNRVRSSPPPKFKFLRDAEEKLYKRLKEEAQKKALQNSGSVQDSGAKSSPNSSVLTEETEGSFLNLVAAKNKERELHHNLPPYPSSSSQVLPLASSPTTFRPLDEALMVH